jgi:membrane protease YdiL (CAAX protease family)
VIARRDGAGRRRAVAPHHADDPRAVMRSLRWFYAGVFAVAWIGWWPMAAGSLGWLRLNLAWWGGVGALSPTVVGIAVAYREGRGAGVRGMFSRLGRWRVGAGWYTLALLLRAGLGFVAVGAVALGMPAPVRLGDTAPAALVGLMLALLVFNVAEEIGWTGFAYPRLRRLFGPLEVGVIVGLVAILWHLPFWLAGKPTFPLLLVPLPVYVLPSALLTVWLLEHTRQSVLISALSHLATNVTMTTLLLVPQVLADVPVYLVYASLLWLVAAAVVMHSGWLRTPWRSLSSGGPGASE